MIKVGVHKVPYVNKKGEDSLRYVTYADIKYDLDGWVDSQKFLPADYDLVYLKIKDKPTKFGWIVGKRWDGLRVLNEDEVLYWKRIPEEKD